MRHAAAQFPAAASGLPGTHNFTYLVPIVHILSQVVPIMHIGKEMCAIVHTFWQILVPIAHA